MVASRSPERIWIAICTRRGEETRRFVLPPVNGVLIREIDGQLDEVTEDEQPAWMAVAQYELLEVAGSVEDVTDVGG